MIRPEFSSCHCKDSRDAQKTLLANQPFLFALRLAIMVDPKNEILLVGVCVVVVLLLAIAATVVACRRHWKVVLRMRAEKDAVLSEMAR